MYFSFVITLVLMNLLIALMSDSYEYVQANAVAADSRLKIKNIYEIERIIILIKKRFTTIHSGNHYFFAAESLDYD